MGKRKHEPRRQHHSWYPWQPIHHSNVSTTDNNNNPSIAAVTAIVNEVLRQKKSGGGADIASIASKEVDKFYDDDDDGRLEEGAHDLLPPAAARPPTRKAHPWNMRGEEAKALFGRGRDKLKAAVGRSGGNGDGDNGADEMERGAPYRDDPSSSAPPTGVFGRGRIIGEGDADFEDICEEMGITPESHPHLRRPYRRRANRLSPQQMIRSDKCQYCLILSCLAGVALIVSSAVSQGFRKESERKSKLHPKWIADREANVTKDWWIAEHGDDGEETEDAPMLSLEDGDALNYEVSDAYLPVWFDRSTGWRGKTYKEAMKFCKSHDDFVPCPYEVYCPGLASRLIFDEVMEEPGLSWAPMLDAWNEWVQVGNGGRQCTTYLGQYKQHPDWGSKDATEDSEEVTRHIMCCLETPLGEEFASPGIPSPPDVQKEHGQGVEDPIPPPPPPHHDPSYYAGDMVEGDVPGSELEVQETSDSGEPPRDPLPPPSYFAGGTVEGSTTGSAFEAQESTELTKLDEAIRGGFRPFWFDDNDGWEGTTWEDGKVFCNSIPSGPNGEVFHLCPSKAYCPNGPDAKKPLVYQMDAFDGGEQWAPISNSLNGWVMVGKISEDQPETCMSYLDIHHIDPEWGTTGSETHLKRHILCCQAASSYDVGITKGEYYAQQQMEEEEKRPGASQSSMQGVPNDVPIVQIAPTDVDATPQSSSQSDTQGLGVNEESAHNGAGNSSPHAGEHNFDDAINAMTKTLNPTWYSSVEGRWSGRSHVDALQFCKDLDKELCPLAAVCPHGSTFPALEGAWLTDADEAVEQWAPVINRPNKWVLIGTIEGNESTSCMDYETLSGNEPAWGLDGSMPELKRHILCCTNYSAHSKAPEHVEIAAETAQTPNIQNGEEASAASEEESTEEDSGAGLSGMVGTWFHAENGWNSGNHNDAVHFCALKEINHERMELCPYHMYCPHGPSQPPDDGRGKIGEGEETEQWAPTSNGDNQWVMVGMHGHNKATQCLTHGQLHGAAPSWGLDSFNREQKRHIMCCMPSQ